MNELDVNAIDLGAVDISVFHDQDTQVLARFLSQNWKTIMGFNYQRIIDAYECGVRKDSVPDHMAAYASELPFESVKFQKGMHVTPFLSAHVYLSTFFKDTSCHYLLFGTHKPVEPIGRAAFFLSYLDRLSGSEKGSVVSFLRSHPILSNNPSFIMKNRCEELAFANDVSLRTLFSLAWTTSTAFALLLEFWEEDVPAILPSNPLSYQWNSVNISSRLAFSLCAQHNLSADFLFMLDYSDLAVWNGKPLDSLQKEMLSAFLCATIEAQDTVLQHLFHALLRC